MVIRALAVKYQETPNITRPSISHILNDFTSGPCRTSCSRNLRHRRSAGSAVPVVREDQCVSKLRGQRERRGARAGRTSLQSGALAGLYVSQQVTRSSHAVMIG